MSAVIQNEYTGNNSTTTYSFTFPYLKTSDIKASLDGVDTTAFTLPNATTLQFNTAPGSGVKIKIFRETSVDDLTATFYAGSAIKSEDLNDNFTQNLYKTQEVGERALNTLGGTMTGNLTLDTQADLVFEGSTANDHETTIKVVDPTADRTITFPNVTGTVVTTGDTGTVARGMIANDAVNGTKIADDSIDSEHYVDGSIDTQHIANSQIIESKLADNAVTRNKIIADAVNNSKLADNAVQTENILDQAVDSTKLAAGAVVHSKLANNSVESENIVNGTIQTADLANNIIDNSKMADDSVGAAEIIDNAVGSAALASNAVTNVKMADNAVGTSELVNDAVVADKIAANAVTRAKIIADAVDGTKIADNAIGNEHLQDDSVRSAEIQAGAVGSSEIASSAVIEAKIADDAVTTNKVANNAITTGKIQDGELKTLAGMVSATASKLAEAQTLTADINDLNIVDGMTKQTTISDTDSSYPTSGAVVDYVAAQIAPLGGLEVIATEVAFPNTQPQAGVVISISDAGGVVFNGSGTSTTGRTVGGSTVTINNAPSSLNSETLVAGVGLMVSSTGSGQVYNYHKILGKEDDIKQLSDDINDFNARYRVGSTNPTSALDAGDLFFNTSTSKLLVYNATNSAWEEAQSIGNFFISTLSPAFDNSTQNFTITNAPTNAEQIILSINGVIQKPNAGTSTPSEGFALDGSTVKLAAAPASGAPYFAIVLGSTVNIGTPSNNTVSSAILQNGSVISTKIANDAVTTEKINGNAVGSSELADGAVINGKLGSECVTNLKVADNAINEQKLQVSNSPVNGYFLQAQSGNTGGMTWAQVSTDLVADTSPQLGGDLDTNSNDINFDTNDKAQFGSNAQLKLYYDGSNSVVTAGGSGDLQLISTHDDVEIRAADNIFLNPLNGAENGLKVIGDGACELYHDGSLTFQTLSEGAKITGNATQGKLVITSPGDVDLYLQADSDNSDETHNPTIHFVQDGGSTHLKVGLEGTAGTTYSNSGGNTPYIITTSSTNLHLGTDNAARWMVTTGGHLYPMVSGNYDIGSSNNRVRNLFTNDLCLSNEGSSNDVDGTWGDWTIQEGESDLFLKNNRSGKKYKFNLTEVS